MTEETHDIVVKPVNKDKVRRLIRVAIILGLVTALEFLVAFTLGASPAKTFLFIIMTIVKAFYIVGEFMHLRHEVKVLIWAIMIPMLFVVWLLVALVYEGGSILQSQ